MLLDDLVLLVVERAGLLQDGARNRELAHVGDPARVLLGRVVLLAEPHHDRPHAGAEERLFGVHDLGRPKVADEWPRLAAAAEIVGDRCADEGDPDQLEEMADPPAEIHERQRERAEERAGEKHEPDDDG